tara:strand:+ start:197 stop:436 length:240 start_codon:yes stop_codon:yes gene_type:complete
MLDEDKRPDIWMSSCCRNEGTVVDKELLKYLSQIGFSLIILFFSIYQIISLDDDIDKSMYFSLISLVVGVYLPSPEHTN